MNNQQSPNTITSKKDKKTIFVKISNYFLDNKRVTIICFLILIILGFISVRGLRTTGFPAPTIDSILISTTYPGASSSTINEKITIPIESKVKEVAGVENIVAQTSDNISNISISPKDGQDPKQLRSLIEAKIKSLQLPSGSESPVVSNLDFGNLDLSFAIVNKNFNNSAGLSQVDKQLVYETYQSIKNNVSKIEGFSKITESNPLKKEYVVRFNNEKLGEISKFGITKEKLIKDVQELNQSLPLVNGALLDDLNTNLSTTNNINSIQELSNVVYKTPISEYKFSDLATIELEYNYTSNLVQSSVFTQFDNTSLVSKTHNFTITIQKGYDQKKFNNDFDSKIKELNIASFTNIGENIDNGDYDQSNVRLILIKQFSAAQNNQVQIDNIFGSLLGSELNIDNKLLAKVGFLFGGIELLFIILTILVSWRSALIACLSVPLSLIFTLIYLYITGESLNTLVLFSFVLVVGLVTDPVLVMLESMQRKFDKGERGRHVIEDAVKEVGDGLFLAFITNTIIFAPFLIVSGIFGQIIKYIPITIVPSAEIGRAHV